MNVWYVDELECYHKAGDGSLTLCGMFLKTLRRERIRLENYNYVYDYCEDCRLAMRANAARKEMQRCV